MSFSTAGSKLKSDINVTPLVDVVLVLLIIFMVITPLLQRGKTVVLPAAQSASESRRDPVYLSITEDGRLWVEKDEVTLATLSDALAQVLTQRPAPIVLRGDRSLDYRIVRQVLGELARARFTGVSLAVTREAEAAR